MASGWKWRGNIAIFPPTHRMLHFWSIPNWESWRGHPQIHLIRVFLLLFSPVPLSNQVPYKGTCSVSSATTTSCMLWFLQKWESETRVWAVPVTFWRLTRTCHLSGKEGNQKRALSRLYKLTKSHWADASKATIFPFKFNPKGSVLRM